MSESTVYFGAKIAKIYYSCLLILQFPSLLSHPLILFLEDSASLGMQDSRLTGDTDLPQGPRSKPAGHTGVHPLFPTFLLCLPLLTSLGVPT